MRIIIITFITLLLLSGCSNEHAAHSDHRHESNASDSRTHHEHSHSGELKI